jgi:hypothetical protein
MKAQDSKTSRRAFIKQTALTAGAVAGFGSGVFGAERTKSAGKRAPQPVWYRGTLRWGQTNITERDVTRYDIRWWREYWKRTEIQGVIVNAGGIVAYYPSRFPLHRRAQFLGDRDMFGDLSRAARAEGMALLARMDSGGAAEEFFEAHRDWFAVDAEGKPFRSRGLYVPCVNGPYYHEYIPGLLREIAERYRPEGFTDNSWSGLGRDSICHCENCARKFREHSGKELPKRRDWDDAAYRQWIQWSYATRLEIWDLNNRATRDAGGPDCIWTGMNSGSVAGQCQSFRDYREICARAELVLLDHQSRSENGGFQQNGETGKLIHGLLGWDKLIPESTALYQAGRPTFRLTAKPEPEVRLWMLEAFAGGIQPWWHHVGAAQEDRRAFRTVEPLMRWHRANQEYLVNRVPVATVGVVWSQQNTDYYGRDDADLLVEQPFRGITQALIRARVPYLPVHADHIERDAPNLSTLVLPNLAALTDSQAAAIRAFVEGGGGLLATGEAGLCNEWGEARTDFALADLFGAHLVEHGAAGTDGARRRTLSQTQHTYLRLTPESNVGKPRDATRKNRHEVLRGFEETDILPFGGTLGPLQIDTQSVVFLTFVPAFPVYPPEAVWMREPETSFPGLILNLRSQKGRVAFLPADIDRRFARDNLPDHGNLLGNLVRWAARDEIPLRVEGPGLIDCHLYHQYGRLILHLVNLTGAANSRAPVEEIIPVGPLRLSLKLPKGRRGGELKTLVTGRNLAGSVKDNWVSFELKSLLDHEVVVIG